MALVAPTVETVGDEALTNSIIDGSLVELQDDLITQIKQSCFQDCTVIKKICLAKAERVGRYAFRGCTGLEIVDLHSAAYLHDRCFENATALATLILRREDRVASYEYNALNNTAIHRGTGYIYVPAALVDRYKAASGWSNYANQIRAIEDYPEVCSTAGKVWRKTVPANTQRNVVVCHDDVWLAGGENGIWYSEDGKNWVSAHTQSTLRVHSIAYGDGVWIAASNGIYQTSAGLLRSTDGKKWSKVGGDITNKAYQVCYGDGVWVAGASDVGGVVSSFDGGVTWGNHFADGKKTATCIAYLNGLWLVGFTGSMAISSDGKTWSLFDGYQISSFCYGEGLWLAADSSVNKIFYSSDGTTWDDYGEAGSHHRRLKYSNGLFVLTSYVGVYTSTDGKTWTLKQGGRFRSVAHSDGMWVACGESGAYYSYDGEVWNKSNIVDEHVECVEQGNGMFVCAYQNIYYSE